MFLNARHTSPLVALLWKDVPQFLLILVQYLGFWRVPGGEPQSLTVDLLGKTCMNQAGSQNISDCSVQRTLQLGWIGCNSQWWRCCRGRGSRETSQNYERAAAWPRRVLHRTPTNVKFINWIWDMNPERNWVPSMPLHYILPIDNFLNGWHFFWKTQSINLDIIYHSGCCWSGHRIEHGRCHHCTA